MQILFAKCIGNQHFLISILPSGLLICLEGKMLTNQHFGLSFYPHQSANQLISESAHRRISNLPLAPSSHRQSVTDTTSLCIVISLLPPPKSMPGACL